MKKYIKILLFFVLILLSFSFASANKESIIYKKISLTNTSILDIYGEKKGKKVVSLIDNFFIKVRKNKDFNKLKKIENIMLNILKKINNKNILTKNDRNLKIIAENLYYRSKILSDYLLSR